MTRLLCSTCKKPLLIGNEFFGLEHFNVQDATSPHREQFCSSPCLIEYLIKNSIDEDSLWAYEKSFDANLWLREIIKRVTQVMAKIEADDQLKKARNGSPHHI